MADEEKSLPKQTGICALCRQHRELLKSHFMPAALYKNLLDPGGPIQNTIITNLETAAERSDQLKQPLLCQECEIRFQQGGESWVLARRLMPDGSFKLREILRQGKPTQTKDGASFYETAGIPEIEPEQLLYFAASVFWRASVGNWRSALGPYEKLPLGANVTEGLRQFLLKAADFPDDLAILLSLSASASPRQIMTLPQMVPSSGKQFQFFIPGMNFALFDGNEFVKRVSISRAPFVVAVDPRVDESIEEFGREHAARSVPTDRLKQKVEDD